MSDRAQADAGRERDPIPTPGKAIRPPGFERPVDESASAHAAPPPAPPLPRSAAGCAWTLARARRRPHGSRALPFHGSAGATRRPHAGAARALLDQRLAALLDAYAADLERDEAAPGSPRPSRRKRLATRRGIAPPIRPSTPLPADTLASLARALDTGHAVPWRDAYPELPLLDVYRDIWAKVSANRQLRQSEQQVPDNAGPLNSNNLVHRSLALMRQLSPGYLHQFLSYLDALAWMEQFDGAVTAARKPRAARPRRAPRAGQTAKPAAAKRSRAKTA